MTLVLDVAPEVEERLQDEAERRGIPIGQLVLRLVEDAVLPPREEAERQPSPRERLDAFRDYLATHDPALPPLPPEAFERESFYGDRG